MQQYSGWAPKEFDEAALDTAVPSSSAADQQQPHPGDRPASSEQQQQEPQRPAPDPSTFVYDPNTGTSAGRNPVPDGFACVFFRASFRDFRQRRTDNWIIFSPPRGRSMAQHIDWYGWWHAGYQYDSTTGLYYDANTGFFYDSNAQARPAQAL